MSSRARQSTAGPSSAARRPIADLPPHEPPAHPLALEQARALEKLHRHGSALGPVQTHLDKAAELVAQMAGEINERLVERARAAEKLRARREAKGREASAAEEKEEGEVESMRERVEAMTKRMEETTRKVIDGQQSVGDMQRSLGEVKTAATSAAVAAAASDGPRGGTRHATQQQQQRTQGENDEDADGNADSAGPTPDSQAQPAPPSLTDMFATQLDRHTLAYQSLPHATRYAAHPTYVGFRRCVHDAQHPGDDVPVPGAATWFTAAGEPAPGLIAREALASGGDGGEDGSDEDIAVARERISTKCPLTLRELAEPVTSAKCPHSFERDAILGLIRESRATVGGRRVVRCPVPGCNSSLAESDIRADPALTRKIQRIQRARQAALDEAENDSEDSVLGDMSSPQPALDGAVNIDDAIDEQRTRGPSVRPKVEGTQSAGTKRGGGGAPPSSSAVVLDLGDGSEETEDEDED